MKDGVRSFVWKIAVVIVIACTFLSPSDSRAQLEGTARDYFGPAEALAIAWHPDAALRYILGAGEEMHIAGETMVWTYLFESSMDDSLLWVAVTLGFPVGLEVSDTLSVLDPLPDNWIDSDAAVAVAEANGGGRFPAEHRVRPDHRCGGQGTLPAGTAEGCLDVHLFGHDYLFNHHCGICRCR